MGRFDRINDDDLMEPGPPVPPMETKPTGRPILMMPPAQRVIPSDVDRALDMPTDPGQWYFAFAHTDEVRLPFVVIFTPVEWWGRFGAQYNQHVTEAIQHALPSYLRDNEEMEATFVPEGNTAQQIHADLTAAGFQYAAWTADHPHTPEGV
jgi:hypothetical protein